MKLRHISRITKLAKASYPFLNKRYLLNVAFLYDQLQIKDNFLRLEDFRQLGFENGEKLFGDGMFLHHYQLLDSTKTIDYNGIQLPLSVNISFKYINEKALKSYPNAVFVKYDKDYYIMEVISGWQHPESEDHKDLWIYDWKHPNEELRPTDTYYQIGDDQEIVKELIQKHINLKTLWFWDKSDVMHEANEFTRFCKTEYFIPHKNYLEITFSIRYKEYVKPFKTAFKKWVKNNKIKFKFL